MLLAKRCGCCSEIFLRNLATHSFYFCKNLTNFVKIAAFVGGPFCEERQVISCFLVSNSIGFASNSAGFARFCRQMDLLDLRPS